MGYASAYVAQQSFSLHVPCPPVVPPSIRTDGGGAIPSLECINIMLAHLLFRGQTLAELVEYEIGVHRRHATYKNYQHPFHCFKPTLWPPTGNGQRLIRFRWQMLKLEGGSGDHLHFLATKAAQQSEVLALATIEDRHWPSQSAAVVASRKVWGPTLYRVTGWHIAHRTFLDGALPPLSKSEH
jgi:hypothetical protein